MLKTEAHLAHALIFDEEQIASSRDTRCDQGFAPAGRRGWQHQGEAQKPTAVKRSDQRRQGPSANGDDPTGKPPAGEIGNRIGAEVYKSRGGVETVLLTG